MTGLRGDYEPGWSWHPSTERPVLFRVDWPVERTGWHRLRARLSDGSEIDSEALWFDAAHPASHASSAARVVAADTELRWIGYGEEMPLAAIEEPFEGDHWWYPKGTYWQLETVFSGERVTIGGGDDRARALFRAPPHGAIMPSAVDGARALFDGHGLEGWYPWLHGTGYRDPGRVFSIRDGLLRISGEVDGYLGTLETFADYRLVLDYRWGGRNHGGRVGKARDAGLFLHAVGPDGNSHDGDGAFRSAIEVQIMEGATGDLLLIRGDDADGRTIAPRLTADVAPGLDDEGWPTWSAGGAPRDLVRWGRLNRAGKDPAWRDEFGFRGADEPERPVGEWNTLEVTSRSGTLEVRLNGRLVNRARELDPSRGAILLQSEGSELEIRRVEISPLDEPSSKEGG